ncbi:Ig-like domain-containing protein, partial [Pseudovibrio sp. W74]|uniref:Ig-like domain-containing protein n=2 Tax=unclassified Pseudovibrio TaxID=2627060 RepID=UPI000ACC5C1E
DTTGTLGAVTVNDDGTFSYDPKNLVGSLGFGETTTDTFTYTVTDSAGASAIETASVTIIGESEILSGSTGDDIYSITADSGSTMIDYTTEVDSGGYDTIVFEDLTLSDLTITTIEHDDENGTALKISWNAENGHPAGQLQIANMGEHIERFEFADGSVVSEINPTQWNNSRLYLNGTDEGDVINGSAKSDLIRGSGGDDILDARGHSGHKQLLEGAAGNDTYYYGTEAGRVRINHNAEREGWGTDKAIFKDLVLSDFTFSTFVESDHNMDEHDTLLMRWSKNSLSGSIEFYDMGRHIERFEFADGTILSSIEVLGDGRLKLKGSETTANNIVGTEGSDFIEGGTGNDTLNAGGANGNSRQFLSGFLGDDTYIYGKQSGITHITLHGEWAESGTDTVVFEDLSLSDLMASIYELSDGNQALRLSWSMGDESGAIILSDMGAHIERFEFSDGTLLSGIEVLEDGRVMLTGTDADDRISASVNDDVSVGGEGNDTFVFNNTTFGNDVITDFIAGAGSDDAISFSVDVFASLEAVLAAASDNGTDTVILLDGDNSITLNGVLVEELHSDDFQFI